jgi:mono/diheme cytochrome c family protein
VELGRALFFDKILSGNRDIACATCHTLADAGATGSVGPNLDDLKPDEATVKNQVTNGGGGMPAFGGQLSDAEITSVAQYVSSVAGNGG